MTRALLDANVFIHALGEHPILRPACRAVLAHSSRGDIVAEASALVIDEVVHVRNRRSGDRRASVKDGRAAAALCLLHPVTSRDVETALGIFLAQPGLQMRDAIHVATAAQHGLSVVLSTDRAFDDIPGLRRIDPADRSTVDSLMAG